MHLRRAVTIIMGLLIAAAVPQGAMAGKAAQVVTLSGKVTMDAPGVSGKVLANNDEVPEGATIKTGPGAVCKLLFTDDTIMDVGAASEFRVDEYKPGDGHNRTGVFSLAYGTMRSLVSKPVGEKGSYKVKTRDAIMGVRGTEFAVSAPFVDAGATGNTSGASTSIVVASGTVAVGSAGSATTGASLGGAAAAGAAGGTMTVTAGQSFSTAQFSSGGGAGGGAAAGGAAAPQPTTMNAGQMQAAMGNARVSDNSLTNAVSMDARSDSGGSSSGSSSGDGGGTASGGGTTGGGNMTMASAVGAVAQTVSVGSGQLLSGVQLAMPNPTAITTGNTITAPPVVIIPGAQRTLTIIVQ